MSSCRPGVMPALDAWFEKALAKSPDMRFSTAREMSRAFSEAIGFRETFSSISSIPPMVGLESGGERRSFGCEMEIETLYATVAVPSPSAAVAVGPSGVTVIPGALNVLTPEMGFVSNSSGPTTSIPTALDVASESPRLERAKGSRWLSVAITAMAFVVGGVVAAGAGPARGLMAANLASTGVPTTVQMQMPSSVQEEAPASDQERTLPVSDTSAAVSTVAVRPVIARSTAVSSTPDAGQRKSVSSPEPSNPARKRHAPTTFY